MEELKHQEFYIGQQKKICSKVLVDNQERKFKNKCIQLNRPLKDLFVHIFLVTQTYNKNYKCFEN